METVLQSRKECFICGTTENLEDHHVFYGHKNRNVSEKYGMKVWLCNRHHTGTEGIHKLTARDLELKKFAQMKFEKLYPDKDFGEEFGRNYL